MSSFEVKRFCYVGDAAANLLEAAVTRLGLRARAYDRILKVGRTIADLAGEDSITAGHISKAIQYRMMDRSL